MLTFLHVSIALLTPESLLTKPAPPARKAAPTLVPTVDRRAVTTALGMGCLSRALPAFAAEDQFKCYPGALPSAAVDKATFKTLSSRGYNAKNTLLGVSVCSDEVNFLEKELVSLLNSRWGETFSMGGLAGVPFAGKAGLGAYSHHVPDEGKLFVVFAPHVGISNEGKVGALERAGMSKPSSACGAAVGAYKALSKPGAVAPTTLSGDLDDLEIDYIKLRLAPKLKGVADAPNDMAYVSYKMYEVVRDAVLNEVASTRSIWDDCSELAVLGGIQINRFGKGDAFLPLMFQTTTEAGSKTDLYQTTFGAPPDLNELMGSSAEAESVLLASL